MSQDKYCLAWQNYSDHLRSMMKEMMMNEDFADVTLVTEDKKHLKANINILSACSPVFKDTLKKEKNSSQIMYLRGIQFSEMESIIQFIYLGEVTFYEERISEFLAVAKTLEIKELCNAETKVEPVRVRPRVDRVSGKFECEQCHKTYSCRRNLNCHKQSVHQGVKYACDQCDYQATTKGSLTVHIQAKHEGIKFPCDQCDYQGSQQSSLYTHKLSVHQGVRYTCDYCDFQGTQQSTVTRHIQSKHEGVTYACDHCDYKATRPFHLSKHILSKHDKNELSAGSDRP